MSLQLINIHSLHYVATTDMCILLISDVVLYRNMKRRIDYLLMRRIITWSITWHVDHNTASVFVVMCLLAILLVQISYVKTTVVSP